MYRENILLTIIGSVVGMVLGNFLHRYIILTVEVEEAMFGRQIHWQSYLYSFLFTVAFFFICKLGNVLQAEEDRYGGIFEERGVKAFASVCQRFLIDGTQRIGKYISQKVYILHRIY